MLFRLEYLDSARLIMKSTGYSHSLAAFVTANLLATAYQMQSRYSSVKFGMASFATNGSSYSYELKEPLTLDVYPVAVALDQAATRNL